jgi:hypothetical protein
MLHPSTRALLPTIGLSFFMWQNHLRNEGSVFQDPDRVILDEARMHVNTHTKHLKP